MANNYMDILYVPDYSPDAPLVMTPEVARALIVAHDEGRGMSDELLARARFAVATPTIGLNDTVRNTVTRSTGIVNEIYPDGMLSIEISFGLVLWHSSLCEVVFDAGTGESERRLRIKQAPVTPIALVFNDAQWRSDISWIWMRELARGNIATTPIKGAGLQVGQVVADGTHTLYRMIEPLGYGELGWSGKVYRQWRVESVNVPRSSVSVKSFFVAQEYRLSEDVK